MILTRAGLMPGFEAHDFVFNSEFFAFECRYSYVVGARTLVFDIYGLFERGMFVTKSIEALVNGHITPPTV